MVFHEKMDSAFVKTSKIPHLQVNLPRGIALIVDQQRSASFYFHNRKLAVALSGRSFQSLISKLFYLHLAIDTIMSDSDENIDLNDSQSECPDIDYEPSDDSNHDAVPQPLQEIGDNRYVPV